MWWNVAAFHKRVTEERDDAEAVAVVEPIAVPAVIDSPTDRDSKEQIFAVYVAVDDRARLADELAAYESHSSIFGYAEELKVGKLGWEVEDRNAVGGEDVDVKDLAVVDVQGLEGGWEMRKAGDVLEIVYFECGEVRDGSEDGAVKVVGAPTLGRRDVKRVELEGWEGGQMGEGRGERGERSV